MRNGIVAALLLALAAGCSATLNDEGTSQTSNATEASMRLASSLSINEVAVFQTLKVTIEKDGVAVPASLPILANRDSLVRAYVTPVAGVAAEVVTATLEVSDSDGDVLTTLTDVKTLAAASTEGDLTSTFNFTVPSASLAMGAKFKVLLTSATAAVATSSAPSNARFPIDGTRASLGVASQAEHLRIVLVPIHYTFGGVDILPDTTPEQLERDRKTFLSLYPLADVEISIHAAYDFSTEIKANGAGFGALLREMLTLRANDGAAGDVYYWGAFQATGTFQEYCVGGCVTGLSGVYGPDSTNGRASVGVGYTGSNSSFTMAHELGHAHGRPHAPCGGAASPDPGFPYADGSIGRWGYAPGSQKLIDPATAKDMMSYCHPQWISDYNYNKLLERLTYVNNAAATATPPSAFSLKLPYRFVEVSPEGTLSFGQSIKLTEAPVGEAHAVAFEDASGKTVAHGDAVFTPYDHIGGGYLLVPDLDVDFKTINVAGIGKAKR